MKEILFSATKKDFKVDTYRGTGPGGQHRNKADTCVRITHIDTGLTASACDNKSQHLNKKAAFRKLAEKIKNYVIQEYNLKKPERVTITVRTYHGVDNRVKDHLSGYEQPYDVVLDNPTKMIEARAEAARENLR